MTDIDVQSEPAEEAAAAQDGSRPSLVDWQGQLLASPGYRALALQDRVKRMGYVFQGNVAQYQSLVAGLQNPAVSGPILDVRNPGAHDELLSEAERLLHNVLTAMSTRVDQQRRFMTQYFADDPALTNDYREKLTSVFKTDVQANFLKGLRNYITHSQLPVSQSKQTLGPASFAITFMLPGESLLRAGVWNGDQRAWIAAQGEAVVIVDVVDSYARKAGEFDKWLFDRIGLKCRADIDAYLRERAEFDREVERLFGV
ncbi:hypothetical protein ACWC24_41795 [Streptomyces sp. NPDC001443]